MFGQTWLCRGTIRHDFGCFELILNSAFDKYRSAQYLADLELKLAMRSDEELANALSPLIEQRETEADELWAKMFKDLNKPKAEIIAIRYLHVSLLRGLAIEYLSRVDKSNLVELEKQFKLSMHAALV